jgi:hypothetical protein
MLLLVVGIAAQKTDTSPILFSAVMQRVSAQPEFRERVLQGLREVPKVGDFLSPDLVNRLRVLILGKEWQRVDHFPALTVAGLNKSVDAAMSLAGKSATPLKPADLLDTAEYPVGQRETIDLDHLLPLLHTETIQQQRSGILASISPWAMDPIPRLLPCIRRAASSRPC